MGDPVGAVGVSRQVPSGQLMRSHMKPQDTSNMIRATMLVIWVVLVHAAPTNAQLGLPSSEQQLPELRE